LLKQQGPGGILQTYFRSLAIEQQVYTSIVSEAWLFEKL
jgi:hypothetical protein